MPLIWVVEILGPRPKIDPGATNQTQLLVTISITITEPAGVYKS